MNENAFGTGKLNSVPFTVLNAFHPRCHFHSKRTMVKNKEKSTRDVRNELLIFLYLDIHVGHDKKKNIYTYLGLFKVYTTVYKCTC